MQHDSSGTSRLYAGVVAVVAGEYALLFSVWGGATTAADWLMVVLGAVVLVHGVAILGRVHHRFDHASGPLMAGYAALMLLDQMWMAATGDTMGTGSAMADSSVGLDPGMAALAVIMLASGVIMTTRRDATPG